VTLEEIVGDYVRECRDDARAEMRFFQIQRKPSDAIRKAALCVLPSGKRHPHQRRIPRTLLGAVEGRLQGVGGRRVESRGCQLKLARGSGRSTTFLLNSVDRLRRTINLKVLAVAREIGPRAVAYGERLLGDAALTMNLFEESAAAVSEALRRKSKDVRPVRDFSAYLYSTFLRKNQPGQGQANTFGNVATKQRADAVPRAATVGGGNLAAVR